MDTTSTITTGADSVFHSYFSFRPLFRAWEQLALHGKDGIRQMYAELLQRVQKFPELMAPIKDETILEKHQKLIAQIMTTIFPVTLSDENDLYAVCIPFQNKTVFASDKFRSQFVDPVTHQIIVNDIEKDKRMTENKLACAYELVAARLYNKQLNGITTTIYAYKCPERGLDKYMELELDTRFVDVSSEGYLPHFPEDVDCSIGCIEDSLDIDMMQSKLPLSNFRFEGMLIVRVRDVTEREVLNIIRERLLDIHTFSDSGIFRQLQEQIQNLLDVPGVQSGLMPFFRLNNHLVFSELHTTSDFVLKKQATTQQETQQAYQYITSTFKHTGDTLVIPDINEDAILQHPFAGVLFQYGWRSAIILPLFANNRDHLLGVLLIVTDKPGVLNRDHVHKIWPAMPLFKLALEKSQENLDHQVDRVIKEQFTAVQDAVEWRFTEAAMNYLTRKNKGQRAKIEPIVFNNVYPLYGAIDIRNSSVERSNAIQLDLLKQLNLASDIIQQAQAISSFPLLEECLFKIQKYVHAITNILFADEEIAIFNFLKIEVVELFKHLSTIMPSLAKNINVYFEAINSPVEMVYDHRKEYEETITTINNEVARFIDEEQKAAQKIFPHYFERFVTDGVEFNIYIGQSIKPDRPFDFFYLKNLKLWQLTTLAKAARLTHSLEKKLPLPLQTTQLILANSHPISISFRTAERKFDVDGAYNIRYEIVKKRIDKVHIKNTNERFTQPGMLAIVYSQPQEATEYSEYIEFLRNQQLLKGEIQKYDLEELQGVSGLKGLRIAIDFGEEEQPAKEEGTKKLYKTN
ncbi:MAG: hypothetical protein QM731_18360 [Chitinophagaceae bacterium]